MKTTLIFVRHGETAVNADKKLHKDKDPNELNLAGKEQISKAAEKVKSFNPDLIYSSKEVRAVQSAKIIAKVCGIDSKTIDGFQERNWGDYSGKTWPEIKEVLDKFTLEERFNYVPPNGESWKEFDARLKSKLDYLASEHKGKTIVIVSHGGAIRALMPHLLGVPKEESFKYDPDNASLTVFVYDGKKYIKKLVNDTSHIVS